MEIHMRLTSWLIFAASLICAGCSTLDYKGSASATTTREDPSLTDYSSGPNLTFALDRPTEYHPASASSEGAWQATVSTSEEGK
jgi:hypothetical protein